jgi:aminoglycoside/choline kinase family phosphotransferase
VGTQWHTVGTLAHKRRSPLRLDLLIENFFGQKVEKIRVDTLKGDASSRSYHRVTMPSGFIPKTFVVMELPEDTLGSDEAVGDAVPGELPFLNVGRYLASGGLRVPKIYFDAVDRGALFLEDFGDELFSNKVNGGQEGSTRLWYGAAVDLLAQMHEVMWPVPEGCLAGKRRFDYELLRWELDHYREWGNEALLGRKLPPSIREPLDEALDRLAEEVANLPTGFVHRDYQSRNLMVIDDSPSPESLAIIDFQDAFVGPRIYDLVALLNDSYVDIPATLKEEMIERYAKRRNLRPDELQREFHLVTVQRKLKDGGRFVFIDRVKNNSSFLKYVDGSFERVRQSLNALSDCETLKWALAKGDPARF